MSLPLGVDILLGQSWLTKHQATLLTWQGQVNFLDDQGLPACWVKQPDMMDNLFNMNVKLSSAASLKPAKQMFVAYVRSADHKAAALPGSICAPVLADNTDPAAESTKHDDSALHARLQNMFIEQQSTVTGIQELVQQF